MKVAKEGYIKELTHPTQISAYLRNGWVEVVESEEPKAEVGKTPAEVKKPTPKKKK